MAKTAEARVLSDDSNKHALAVREPESDTGSTKEAKASFQACNKAIENAHNGLRTYTQSRQQFEKVLAESVNVCLNHAKMYGDVRPMDTLVKPLFPEAGKYPDKNLQMLGNEIVAWLRKYSPIRWDAKGKVYLAKEGDDGYNPFVQNVEQTETFYETAQAKRARGEAEKTQARELGLRPASIDEMRKRLVGLRNWWEGAAKKDKLGRKRGYKNGKAEQMRGMLVLNGVLASFDRMIGEQAADEEKAAEAALNNTEENQENGSKQAAAA